MWNSNQGNYCGQPPRPPVCVPQPGCYPVPCPPGTQPYPAYPCPPPPHCPPAHHGHHGHHGHHHPGPQHGCHPHGGHHGKHH
ncbi:hypothetical protein FKM82_015993 [Ascaphus truei]